MNATQHPPPATAHTAVYLYRHGDRLKRVDSTFPDGSVPLQYVSDGLGKLREKVVDSTDVTWYRWELAWYIFGDSPTPF